MKSQGIVYIAFGYIYVQMAIRSAKSVVNNYVGECPQIIIFTNTSVNLRISPYISLKKIEINYPADPIGATAYLKINLNSLSKFAHTLYLDCDTKAIGNISGIWEYIGDSIAVAPAYNPIRRNFNYPSSIEATETRICLSKIGNYTQYNTGVFLFEKSAYIDKVFKLWLEEWIKYKQYENMAFTRLTNQDINVNPLNSKYNQFYPDMNSHSVIIHYIGSYKDYL